MSRVNRGTVTADRHSQQPDAGRDLYNPNTAQDLYDREFNGIVDGLGDVEKKGSRIINDNADSPDKYSRDVQKKEIAGAGAIGGVQKSSKSGGMPGRVKKIAVNKLKGKSALVTVLAGLIFGGGTIAISSAPAIAPVVMAQSLTQDLGDQFKAFDDRHAYIMRAKFKNTTTQSCGVSPMACRFAKMSDKQAERFANKGVTVERDPNGRITSMSFPDPNGGPDSVVTSAREMQDRMKNDSIVRTGMQRVENPWFASMTDKVFKLSLAKLGTSKASRITGNTNEERERSVGNTIGQSNEIDTSTLTPERDADGNETGRLIGPDGIAMTQEQIDEINRSGRIVDSATNIKPGRIAASIGTAVLATGTLDAICTTYNASRMVGALAKTEKMKQAAQMVMPSLLVPANKIMAGDATEGEIEYVGNKINNIGGPAQPEEVVDETKLYESGTERAPPMIENKAMYATAFDSPGMKAALHGDVIPLNTSQARFSLAGGFIGTLNKLNEFIARALGSSSPKELSQKCKYIQNPYVRGAALVAGIFIGIGSLGTYQAAGIVASLAIGMSLPYLVSIAADIASGDMFKNLYGDDFGSGAFVGTAGIMSTAAQKRGLEPLSASEAVAYTQSNQESLANYGETQRLLARAEPFNVYNQYSFLGSLAFAVTPTLANSHSSVSTMAASVANLIPHTFAAMTGTAKAASTIDRFQQCPDIAYKELKIGADIYCNVRHGLSEETLAIDPIENAKWMESSRNISATDDTGEPIDNDQTWNYKKFLRECVDRTVGYGEDQEENQGDGSNCLSDANDEQNQKFRAFTLDRGIIDFMDGIDTPSSAASGAVSGIVSSDGWAYPTTRDGNVTSGYKAPDRGDDHRGVDITHVSGSLGKPIFAVRDGKVVASGPADGFGSWIVITHEVDGKKVSSVYGHMRASDLNVKVGDTVKAGQQIARIGNEGQSTGPHLHFEIWNGNRLECGGDCSINPTQIIEKAKQGNTPSTSSPRSRENEVNL